MADVIITEDVEAILNALVAYDDLADMIGDKVFHLQANEAAEPPYLLIIDAGLEPIMTFQNTRVAWESMVILRSITIDDANYSAQKVAADIHREAFNALDGVSIQIGDGDFKTLRLNQGRREPTFWENVDDQNRFFHMGFRYLATYGPS